MVLQRQQEFVISHFICSHQNYIAFIMIIIVDKMIINIITRMFVDTEIVWVINKYWYC